MAQTEAGRTTTGRGLHNHQYRTLVRRDESKTPIARYHHSRLSNFTRGESVWERSRLNGAWVYNMDETWITSEERSLRVIVPRDWSKAPKVTETDKSIH